MQAQTATELRISGTVEKLDGNLVALSLSQGISIVVRLDSGAACELGRERLWIGSESRVSGEHSGQERSKRRPHRNSGRLVRSRVEQTRCRSRGRQRAAGRHYQVRYASPEGPVLTVADKDEDRKITIGPDTAIWIARAARIADIKVGSAVTMTAVKREDGSLQVLRANFGPAGAGNPPL